MKPDVSASLSSSSLNFFDEGISVMSKASQVTCELCGEKADILQNSHVDPAGKRIEWPKATVRSDGLYFAVHCPECGEREQCMAKPGDTD